MKLTRVLLCIALALSLGCGALAAGFEPALDVDTECEVRVAGHYSNFEAIEAEFDRFNDIYPNVALTYTGLDDYNNTILAALSDPEGPEIFASFTWMLDKETYVPLFEAAEDLADPALGIDLDCLREGLLYRDESGAAPMATVFSTTYGILVNEDIFEKTGVAVPTTFDELFAAVDALRAAGYADPLLGYNSDKNLPRILAFPHFCASVQGDAEAVAALNALEPEAGEYMRPTLEMVKACADRGLVDLDACNALEDDYTAVILRFFEGDVPMMCATGDTVSGTRKRESMSDAYTAHPFAYSFRPLPTDDDSAYFLNDVSVALSVNKNAENRDMANEFMRFLITTEELSNMASIKRLVTPTRDMSFDGVYAAFGDIDADHTIYELTLGLLDAPCVQLRKAAYNVLNGLMTVDEAVAAFGNL